MDIIEYKGKLKHYLRAPIYLVFVMVPADIGLSPTCEIGFVFSGK